MLKMALIPRHSGRTFALVAPCVLGLVILALGPLLSDRRLLVLHSEVELIVVFVSLALFALEWHGARYSGDRRGLVLGALFFGVGLFALLHAATWPDDLSRVSATLAGSLTAAAFIASKNPDAPLQAPWR